MATNQTPASSANKLVGTICFACIAALSVVVAYFVTRETGRRSKIAADVKSRVENQGQEIVNAAFPARIGAAPLKTAKLEGITSGDDGYRARVILYYTNIVNDDNYLELVLSYDSAGVFRGARLGKYNDRWVSPDKLALTVVNAPKKQLK